ncbi:peptide synthetase [Caballeronia sp. DA-9]|uniref:peptide synthetase n=1 Tax=Caballeronia sp. DA-9 TaxID=3436237 RepID=UPI003F67C94F
MDKSPLLFDFSPYLEQREEVLPLIRQFAAHDGFRSAVVEELELDEDFYRRPLRPEDLEFLQFKKPVRAETVSRLPALASQRMLLSLNEAGVARMPRAATAEEFARFDAFYGERNQVLGARIRNYLEHYAFAFLGNEASGRDDIAAYVASLATLIADEKAFWNEMFALLVRNDYLVEGLRFIMIQRWSLAPSRRMAVSRAAASGYFDAVEQADEPALSHPSDDALLARVAQFVGLTRREHSYWQFYLPTSLAKCNLLYALAARPDRAFALLGAAYATEAESIAFAEALAEACPHLVAKGESVTSGQERACQLSARFERALGQVQDQYGSHGLYRVGQGWGAGVKLAARARWDLGEQLSWLSAIDSYVAHAKHVEGRIEAECPGIDRETFVEPREMCSTTHVHNDHRLVVIESGDMIFWGNLGMQHKMKQGDSVLIPDGRLHGSTVVSEECTYHQPIIPNEWIEALQASSTDSRTSATVVAS